MLKGLPQIKLEAKILFIFYLIHKPKFHYGNESGKFSW